MIDYNQINKVLDKLVEAQFSGSDYKMILFVLRKTIFWNKEEDQISYTQFEKALNLNRKDVRKTIIRLEGAKVLLVTKKELPIYKINTDLDSWVVTKKQLVTIWENTSYQIGKKVVTKKQPTKNIYTTETIQSSTNVLETSSRSSKPSKQKDSRIDELINYMLEKGDLAGLDGTQDQNRRMAKNLFNKLKKLYPEHDELKLAKQLVDIGHTDSFHSTKLTKVSYLFYHMQTIINMAKQKSQRNQVVKI